MDMKSYTYMSTEGITALHKAIMSDPDKLNLQLNHNDALKLIDSLVFVHVHANNVDLSDWAGDFVASLAAVHGIEWV